MSTESTTATTSPGLSPYQRLLALLAPERRDIALVIAFSIGVGILTLATPVALQALVNFVAFGGLIQPLVVLGALLFACLALAGALRAFKTYVVEVLQRRVFVRVVADLADRLPRVRADMFDRGHGPELVNRFFDVLTVQKVGAMLLLDGIGVVLQTLVGLLVLAFYHPVLLAFDVVLVAGIVLVIFVLGRGAVRTAVAESKAKYAVEASLEEIARNPLTFKLHGGGAFARARADALAVEYVHARRAHFRIVLRQVIGAVGMQAIAATALLTLGGWLVMAGQLTLGQLVAAELIVSTVLASFAKLGKQLEGFYDLLAAVDKLGQLMDVPLERVSGEDAGGEAGGSGLALHGVSFGYDTSRPLIRDFSLVIQPGEHTCIVGGHGAGKSTLVDLLYGLRVPTAGRIELDGVDLRELTLSAIRRKVALVKGFEIIEGAVDENVRMNRRDVTSGDVRAALAAVGLLEEIRMLPEGLGTQLTSTGLPLSFGQSRRLMLARAIAGQPRVLVLDDLLDDLDAEARQTVVQALFAPERNWTLILMSRSAWLFGESMRVVRLRGDTLPGAPSAGNNDEDGAKEHDEDGISN